MSTSAQIQANQSNAQFSTGPTSPEGKSAAAQNSTKHGLTATYPVIRTPEEQHAFDSLTAALQFELRPITPTDQIIFKHLIHAAWNIDRCHRLEAEIASSSSIDPLLDEDLAKTLARLATYRLRAERVFHKSLKELQSRPAAARPTQPVKNEPKFYSGSLSQYVRPTPKLGRNEPCPCASGRKYKHCCMGNEPNLAHAA